MKLCFTQAALLPLVLSNFKDIDIESRKKSFLHSCFYFMTFMTDTGHITGKFYYT